MPELPEVEVTRCGIEPHIAQRQIGGVIIRQSQLRWSIPLELPTLLAGQRILSVGRRAKYWLLNVEPCVNCQCLLTATRLAWRSTVFCRYCQR